MGKKRIAVIGADKAKTDKPKGKTEQKIIKTGKQQGRLADTGAEALAEAIVIEEKAKKLEKEIEAKATKKSKTRKPRPTAKKGKRYQTAKKLVKPTKLYPLLEAIKLLKTTSITRFKGTAELHLVTHKTGLKVKVEFPHDTGKTSKIAIADDKLLKQIEKGKIDFNLLIAAPAMMPKLAKYAKILGPRGLMPNPKTGTISDKPEELAKEMGGKLQVKTEGKAPLMHIVIGKVEMPEKKLVENFRAIVTAVGLKNIRKAVLTSTMGPGIKIDLTKID